MKMQCAMRGVAAGFAVALVASAASAGAPSVQYYGDVDLFGFGWGSVDPVAGATLVGVASNVITFATDAAGHGFPFTPEGDDYPGTDQIYAGAFNYAGGDGYSNSAGRINNAQIIDIDYSAQVPEGQTVESLTLGIAADDFQNPLFGNPFTAVINNQVNQPLTDALNELLQTGPITRFLTIGIDPALIRADNTLTLIIRQAAGSENPQGDGWAIDFLTIGVETIPTPGAASLAAMGLILAGRRRR